MHKVLFPAVLALITLALASVRLTPIGDGVEAPAELRR